MKQCLLHLKLQALVKDLAGTQLSPCKSGKWFCRRSCKKGAKFNKKKVPVSPAI